MKIELIGVAVTVGLGATLIMDICTVILEKVSKIPAPDYCLVGRWLRHMSNGTFRHPAITTAAPMPAECRVGWFAHYTTGILFTLALVMIFPLWLESPTLMPALVFGVATVGFPFFIMHPAFGLGLAASKAKNPLQARLRSIANHAMFGMGLYVSAVAISTMTQASS